MERLTYVDENGEVLFHLENFPEDRGLTIMQLAEDGRYKALEKIAERLANREQYCELLEKKLKQYQELKKKGLSLKPSIHIGISIWDIDFGRPYSYDVTGFSYGVINNYDYNSDEKIVTDEIIVHYKNMQGGCTGCIPISEIGKSVFLTKEEAEEKLKAQENLQSGEIIYE